MSNEWYTPEKYIEAAREVLGTIDLDPASSVLANETIKAEKFYTEQENGLLQDWTAKSVWLNPPYGRIKNQSVQSMFLKKLLTEYRAGNIEQAIFLSTADTDEKWFQPLWEYAICFADHHIYFDLPGQHRDKHMFGTAFTYLGPHEDRFIQVFSQFGTIAKRLEVA